MRNDRNYADKRSHWKERVNVVKQNEDYGLTNLSEMNSAYPSQEGRSIQHVFLFETCVLQMTWKGCWIGRGSVS